MLISNKWKITMTNKTISTKPMKIICSKQLLTKLKHRKLRVNKSLRIKKQCLMFIHKMNRPSILSRSQIKKQGRVENNWFWIRQRCQVRLCKKYSILKMITFKILGCRKVLLLQRKFIILLLLLWLIHLKVTNQVTKVVRKEGIADWKGR